MITSRRIALASAAIVLGLSACGSANTQGAAGSTPATVVTASTSDAAPSSPRVIHLGSVSAGAAAATARGETAPTAADSKMMAIRNVRFVFDATVPTLVESGPSWQLPAGFTPDQARVAAMAAALGVDGDVRALPVNQGGGWMVGPADYSAATLTVSADSLGSWWFSPAPTATPVTSTCGDGVGDVVSTETVASPVEAATTNVVAPPACADPAPPAGVPGEAAALVSAKSLMTTLGYDPSGYGFEFYGDQWSASVSAYALLGGQRSQLSLNLGFGGEGSVAWASGSLATPAQSGNYPLAGVQIGLDRLNDQAHQWMSYGGYAGSNLRTEGAVGAGTLSSSTGPAAAEPVDPAAAPAVAPLDTTGITMDPMPCGAAVDCAPIDTTPETIHLTDVRLDTTLIWEDDGTVWLLPAYTFTDADGGSYSIIAVAAEFLDLPAPAAIPFPEPLPVVTTGDSTVGATGDTVPADTIATTPAQTPVDQSAAEKALVGLDERAATDAAIAKGWTIRVAERNGVSLPVTADYSATRIDVAVTDGVVVAVNFIG